MDIIKEIQGKTEPEVFIIFCKYIPAPVAEVLAEYSAFMPSYDLLKHIQLYDTRRAKQTPRGQAQTEETRTTIQEK